MTNRPVTRVLLSLALLCSLAAPALAQDATVEDFLGVYVGVAHVLDEQGQQVGERHVDMVVEPDRGGGFKTTTIVVTLAQGRRDVAGVSRDVISTTFSDEGDGVYLVSERGSLFSKKKAPDLMAGEALRWARIKGQTLSLYSFAIEPDGRYELQITDRTLAGDGIDLHFRRYVDGVVVRTVTGRTVRIE